VVNTRAEPASVTLQIQGGGRLKATGTAITLSGDPDDQNSLDHPRKVSPVPSKVQGVRPEFAYTFGAHSLTVLRLGLSG